MIEIKKHRPLKPVLFGVPEVIRTPDLSLRRRSLYPAELREHILLNYSITESVFQ